MSIIPSFPLQVSGERFRVRYRLEGDEKTARERAEDVCIEQTIEYLPDLVPPGGIREHVFGRIEAFAPIKQPGTRAAGYEAVISYAEEIIGGEFPQLLNVIFGNISMKPGVRVLEVTLTEGLLKLFKGPRFGVEGLRSLVGQPSRPLLFTAIKPIGLSAAQLAEMARALALGGIDILKDDHGLANQPFAPYRERVTRVAQAVAEANTKTGGRTLYAPNVTGPFETMLDRIFFAKEAGATALLIMPGYCGLDFVRRVAEDETIGLPVIVHPAFMGSYVLSPDFGISHFVLHGQLMRLAGADISVMPNYIGRFSYSREDCIEITRGCQVPMGHVRRIFPGPGGGISPESFADMLTVYGPDVAYLMSGNLHRPGPDLAANVRRFRAQLERLAGGSHE